jgi:hypothetical protein
MILYSLPWQHTSTMKLPPRGVQVRALGQHHPPHWEVPAGHVVATRDHPPPVWTSRLDRSWGTNCATSKAVTAPQIVATKKSEESAGMVPTEYNRIMKETEIQ